jgi:hypothetical protein
MLDGVLWPLNAIWHGEPLAMDKRRWRFVSFAGCMQTTAILQVMRLPPARGLSICPIRLTRLKDYILLRKCPKKGV